MTTLVVARRRGRGPARRPCSSGSRHRVDHHLGVGQLGRQVVHGRSSCAASMPPTGSPARSVLRATVTGPTRCPSPRPHDQQHRGDRDRQCDREVVRPTTGRVRCTRPRFVRWGGNGIAAAAHRWEVVVTGISDTVVPGTPEPSGPKGPGCPLGQMCTPGSSSGPATVVHDGIHRGRLVRAGWASARLPPCAGLAEPSVGTT